MTRLRLLTRGLAYHWRGNLAVTLGVAVGTAVLTGALLVGDSLRGSLRDQALEQLGWVHQALVAGRFFRADLAKDWPGERICPAILMRGAATRESADGKETSRAGRVTILGVDERFFEPNNAGQQTFWQSDVNQAAISATLARDLGVAPAEKVTIHLQKISAVPRESLLGHREAGAVVDAIDLTVHSVLTSKELGGFNLFPSPEPARNVFVPLRTLQKALNQPGRANALLSASDNDLQASLRERLTLDDWGLVLNAPRDRSDKPRGYFSLESRQMMVEPAVAEAALAAAKQDHLIGAPTMVYLANSIADGKASIPYSIVAAIDPSLSAPLGPFLPPDVSRLSDDEIVLADWKESPLHAKPGDTITLKYFKPEDEGRLPEVEATFKLKGFVPLQGVADDRDLTPAFPGITDKLNIQDWNPPFPYDNKRVQSRDERYWRQYRTTPKAYITLAAGQKLWGSRFGDVTSIRLDPTKAPSAPLSAAAMFAQAIVQHLDPSTGGFVFENVRQRALDASAGGTDFGLYFVGFSLFLILAALLLVGLLFRLNLDRRAPELGILLAAGYRTRTLRWLWLTEGVILSTIGALIGLVGAVLYARFMLDYLHKSWPGGLGQSFLAFHATSAGFLIGFVASLAISTLAVFWAVRVLGKIPPRSLLAGATTPPEWEGDQRRRPRWSRWIAIVAAVGAIAMLVAARFMKGHEEQAGTFFTSGMLLLIACIAGLWAWMRSQRRRHLIEAGAGGVARLGVRNSWRHPVRSLLTIGLLASAVFVVVAVESFHRDASQVSLDRTSGTGGFALLAETDVPIFQDLNSDQGRDELNFQDRDVAKLRDSYIIGMRLKGGDDASCLNLYQPRRPKLLGVPKSLIDDHRFQFADTAAKTPETKQNPWLLLKQPLPNAIPAFADATTAEYTLHKKLGDTIEVPNEQGRPQKLQIVGLLADSIFQSELLVSEANFLKLYPGHEGYSLFLIDAPADRVADVRSVLESNLAERGFEATPTDRRLAAFWAVENTYLSTFQALGGFGVLLGALGLAVVLLRTVWERRGELALFRALGFRRAALGRLVLAENGFLLVLGLAVGVLSALAAVWPFLGSGSGTVPWLRLVLLIGAVLIVGVTAATLAVMSSLRAALVPALRRE